MKYCSHCGSEIADEAVVCVKCGCPVNGSSTGNAVNDEPNIGYAILGFCIPIAGLILYLIWKDETPLRAKSAGKGALVSVIVSAIFYIFYFIFIAAMLSNLPSGYSITY